MIMLMDISESSASGLGSEIYIMEMNEPELRYVKFVIMTH